MKYTGRFTLLFSLLYLGSFAQNDSAFLRKATASLPNYTDSNPIEKVYLHLDRQNYYPGDTIWFKAYTVAGPFHQLSAISGVLYCELINSKDSVVIRHTLKLKAGITWGDFTLQRSYKPGVYHIRAYTSWMRNAGVDYFYNQPVRILGPISDARMAVPVRQGGNKITDGHPDVQFFPEGGELVGGLRSKVAVKSVNTAGLGESVSGVITDNEGKNVVSFTTPQLGMGVFAFTPESGKLYKAQVMTADGQKFTVDLPVARDEGYGLTMNNAEADSIYIKVSANDKLFNTMQNSMFYLVAQSAGKVYYTTQSKLSVPVFTVAINKNRFPSGIVQFTLFSQTGEPLNERIAFIQNNDGLDLKLSLQDSSHAVRGKVKIGIGSGNDSSRGTFSVAVINESRVPANENDESTILTNLLLTSDLKGYIEQPNYYFTNVNDQKRIGLDVLMLSQGYRRFEWQQVLSGSKPVMVYQPQAGLELNGVLKSPLGTPLPKGKITLAATRDAFITDTTTDANGGFTFSGLDLSDTSKIVLRARKEHNGSNVLIYVKEPDYPVVMPGLNKGPIAQNTLSPEMLKNIADYNEQQKQDSINNGRQLQEVKITAKKLPKPDQYNHYGTVPEYMVNMKRLNEEFIRVKEGIMFLVPGLHYVFLQSQPGVPIYKYEHDPRRVRIIIDGFERSQAELESYSSNEIESIGMVNPTAFDPPTLIVTSKNYAGTDTTSAVKLKTVTITARKERPKPDLSHSSNLHGGGNADQVIMGDKLGACVDLSDCLDSKITGVIFSQDGAPINTRPHTGAMSVILDGIILPGSSLNDINSNDIYSIEVLRSGAARSIYGSSIGGGGALIITTKRGAGRFDTAKVVTLKQVNIKATVRKGPNLEHSANLNGPGHADQVLMGDQLGDGCPLLSDCIYGKLTGIYIVGPQTGVDVKRKAYLLRAQHHLSGALAMTVIVDGMILGPDHLDDVNPTDIYSIEVLRSGGLLALYGSNAAGGALVITTKRGDESRYTTSTEPAGLITYPFKGYHLARVFYSPKYDHPKADNEHFDNRSTIYWNPNIITDKNGKASFEYYNADTKGTYRVVVEGIDDEGRIGRAVYRYVVK